MLKNKGVLSTNALRELNKTITPRHAKLRIGLEIDKLSIITPPTDRYMPSMLVVMELMERREIL